MSTMSSALGAFITNVATTYAEAMGRKLSTVSLAAADDPNILPRIAKGDGKANFTIERFDRIVGWFIEHWPHDAHWPTPPAWPFPRPATRHDGDSVKVFPDLRIENNGKTSEEGRRRNSGQAEARKAAKGSRSTKVRTRRKEAQHRGGERPAD